MSGKTDEPKPGQDPAEVAATFQRSGGSTSDLGSVETPADAGQDELPRLAPGESLAGRFTVLRFIARGGMGAVYEANDVLLRTRVALKVLQGRIAENAETMERFRREVLLARRVSHPCVCRVYELYQATTGTGMPIHFLTMEFLDGETLSARLARKGRMTTGEALPLVQQMCSGLAAAHAEGVIHRDFKSSNVLLVAKAAQLPQTSGEGIRVAITDFGIARALLPEGVEGASGLTGDAGIVGTPEYMAPEQVTGGEVSQATDVYALGIVLYEMVTGRLPFSASTPLATASRRLDEPPPRPEATVPGLDPRWSRAILRCLERDPRRRFASANDVAAALIGQRRTGRWPLALAGAALLALLLAAGLFARRHFGPAPVAAAKADSPGAAAPSIAVLPFVDMSPQHDQGYFSDGVAEEIINALAQVPGLHVAARSSSFTFKGTNEDLRAVAQKLGVANVLEGSVRKSGNRLRVTAQLVSAQDGYQLWSRSFDSELADVFAVQDQIAGAVVAALKMKVLPAATSAPSARKATSPEAYTHYLRGLELYSTGSVPGYRAAIEEYEKAVALDPEYAAAHAAIATAALLYGNSLADDFETHEWNRRARAEADRAVELDPIGVEGLVARGRLRTILTWDWPGAHADLERAVALGPGVANAQMGLAGLLSALGQLPAALEAAKKGYELDPVSSLAAYQLAFLYNSTGQYALARKILKKSLETAPDAAFTIRELGMTELLDGHPAEALAIFKTNPVDWMRDLGAGLAEHSLGNEAASKAALERLESKFGTTAIYQVAQVHAWRGERDAAFEWLEKSRKSGDAGLRYMKHDAILKSLREDPRFAAMLTKLKLPLD
jgi:TolB-like protein/tRNA A-37 threonylcarbamoyl transferase component Bud32/Tfp pilus assembly protein PilF